MPRLTPSNADPGHDFWYTRTPCDPAVSVHGGGMLHPWVGQIVTFFAYSPPSRHLGSLTPTQPGRVTDPTEGCPGPPWEAPQA
eukprot:scaffold1288_cov35-Phaeocystis_antarctica.AAC.2